MVGPSKVHSQRGVVVRSSIVCNKQLTLILNEASHQHSHSHSRSRSRSRSRPHSRSRSRPHSRSRPRSHSRSRLRLHTHSCSSSPDPHQHNHSRSRSPRSQRPRRSYSPRPHHSHASHLHHHLQPSSSSGQPSQNTWKGKEREHNTHLPSPPPTWTQKPSMLHRERPGPSTLARPKTRQERTQSTSGGKQSDSTPQEVEVKGDRCVWRHIGKEFAIAYTPWLAPEELEIACRAEAHDYPSQSVGQNQSLTRQAIFQQLTEFNIKPDVRTDKNFQSEVSIHFSFLHLVNWLLVFSSLQAFDSFGLSLLTPSAIRHWKSLASMNSNPTFVKGGLTRGHIQLSLNLEKTTASLALEISIFAVTR